jgi:hypothetical protein
VPLATTHRRLGAFALLLAIAAGLAVAGWLDKRHEDRFLAALDNFVSGPPEPWEEAIDNS